MREKTNVIKLDRVYLPLHYNVRNIFLQIFYFSQEYQRTPLNLKQICRVVYSFLYDFS